MWLLALLAGDLINSFFIRKCMAILPGEKSGRNKEVTVLLRWP